MAFADDGTILAVFDEDGNYLSTYWETGDLISKPRMNKIEDALWYNTQYILQLQNESATHQPKEDDSLQTTNKTVVGGINELNNSVNLMLSKLDEVPTYTQPSLLLSLSKGILEHGVESSVTITPMFSSNDSGGATNYTLERDGEVIYFGGINSYIDTLTLSHGVNTTYSATLDYEEGETKQTLLGIDYPNGKVLAGSKTFEISVTGYAPSYFGVISNNVITEGNIPLLNSRLSTIKSLTYETNLTNQRIVFMYPKDFGKLTSIKDANNFDYINSYTLSNMTYNYVEYYVYILTDPVTITNFKQIFS